MGLSVVGCNLRQVHLLQQRCTLAPQFQVVRCGINQAENRRGRIIPKPCLGVDMGPVIRISLGQTRLRHFRCILELDDPARQHIS